MVVKRNCFRHGCLIQPREALWAQSSGAGSLDLKHMPDALAGLIREAYGDATGHIFLIAAFAALVALVALVVVLFIKEVPLLSTVSLSTSAEEVVAAGIAGVAADQSSPIDTRFSRQPGRHRYPEEGARRADPQTHEANARSARRPPEDKRLG